MFIPDFEQYIDVTDVLAQLDTRVRAEPHRVAAEREAIAYDATTCHRASNHWGIDPERYWLRAEGKLEAEGYAPPSAA